MKNIFIKILIIGVLIFSANTNASTKFEKAYMKLSGINKVELQKITANDDDYLIANDFMFDDAKMISKTVDISDPESKNKKAQYKQVFVPNIVSAIEYYEKSVEKTNNPISAYSGIYLIGQYVGKKQFKYLPKYRKFAETLYKEKKKICLSYIAYGEVYEKGFDIEKNIEKAYEIYNKGIKDKSCDKTWESNVLNSKIWTLRREISKK